MDNLEKSVSFSEQQKQVDSEYIESLMEKYSYIALKYSAIYKEDMREDALNKALQLLRCSLIDYIKRDEIDKKGLSHFIHNRFRAFDNYVKEVNRKKIPKTKSKIVSLNTLEQLAYNKDIKSRVEIFNRNKKLIDKKAMKLYNNFIEKIIIEMSQNGDYSYLDNDFVFSNNLIEYSDIIQDYYLRSWDFLNKFYDDQKNQLEKKSFSMYLAGNLNHYNYFNLQKLQNYKFADVLAYGYNDFSYQYEDELDKIETDIILDNISSNLNGNMKDVLLLIRKGYSYAGAAKVLDISRSRAQRLQEKVLKIVKKENII